MMLKHFFIIYIVIIIIFNIIIVINYKSFKEHFTTTILGINSFDKIYNQEINDYLGILDDAKKNKLRTIVIKKNDETPIYNLDNRIHEFLNRFGNDWDVLQLSTHDSSIATTNIYPGLDSVVKVDLDGSIIVNSSIYDRLHVAIYQNKIQELQTSCKWYLFT
jgi:hypothetical protein